MVHSIDERRRLQAELTARVAAGETVTAVCAGPGFPSPQQIHNWAKAEPWFRDQLSEAVRRGRGWRRGYHDDKAAAFLARVYAGERVCDLWGKPGMPSRKAYFTWKTANPVFADAMWQVRLAQRQRLAQHGRDGYRAWDPALADRLIVKLHHGARLADALAGDPDLPCAQTLRRWRREQPQFDRVIRRIMAEWRRRRARGRHRCTPALIEVIGKRIATTGISLHRLSQRADMPCEGTLYRWMAEKPQFAEAVTLARRCWAEWTADVERDAGVARWEAATGGEVGGGLAPGAACGLSRSP